jgi:hypothetical protein
MRHTSPPQHAGRRRMEEAVDGDLKYKKMGLGLVDSSHSFSTKKVPDKDGTASPPAAALRDFIWRLDGGRRSELAMGLSENRWRDRAPSPMTFDPWASSGASEDDGGCIGCERIRAKEEGLMPGGMELSRRTSGMFHTFSWCLK